MAKRVKRFICTLIGHNPYLYEYEADNILQCVGIHCRRCGCYVPIHKEAN